MEKVNEKKVVLEIIKIIADAIKEVGNIPSGHLYVRLMNYMSLSTYESIINILEKGNFIQVKNHLITWIKKD